MRLLLDTHALLWSLGDPDRLDAEARGAIQDAQNDVLVSAASVWEMAIKSALGKLSTPDDLLVQLRLNRFDALDVTLHHAQAAEHLPMLHRDPFDRMLVAQARSDGLRLVTRDPLVQQYDVPWMSA